MTPKQTALATAASVVSAVLLVYIAVLGGQAGARHAQLEALKREQKLKEQNCTRAGFVEISGQLHSVYHCSGLFGDKK